VYGDPDLFHFVAFKFKCFNAILAILANTPYKDQNKHIIRNSQAEQAQQKQVVIA